jgi:hypothetical protein
MEAAREASCEASSALKTEGMSLVVSPGNGCWYVVDLRTKPVLVSHEGYLTKQTYCHVLVTKYEAWIGN